MMAATAAARASNVARTMARSLIDAVVDGRPAEGRFAERLGTGAAMTVASDSFGFAPVAGRGAWMARSRVLAGGAAAGRFLFFAFCF